MSENIVLFCNCQIKKDNSAWIKTATRLNHTDDIRQITLTDLCGVSAMNPDELAGLINHPVKVLLIACHPRAVRFLLNKAGICETDHVRFFNLVEENPDDLMTVLQNYRLPGPDTVQAREIVSDPSWPAWYPVIDEIRCNSCGQCSDFCLFGVYQKTEGKVSVVNPKNCKNNCPACARICPRVAIIFPKYAPGGAIGGSESMDETTEMQRLQQDTDAILGSDIYQALEQRKLKRRLVIREDEMEQAIRERDEALKNVMNK
jgi:NAD-dependent dihydropyrimidine dehydrogenase PreA subunit